MRTETYTPPSSELLLLQEIASRPEDHCRWYVYADWLEEQGRSEAVGIRLLASRRRHPCKVRPWRWLNATPSSRPRWGLPDCVFQLLEKGRWEFSQANRTAARRYASCEESVADAGQATRWAYWLGFLDEQGRLIRRTREDLPGVLSRSELTAGELVSKVLSELADRIYVGALYPTLRGLMLRALKQDQAEDYGGWQMIFGRPWIRPAFFRGRWYWNSAYLYWFLPYGMAMREHPGLGQMIQVSQDGYESFELAMREAAKVLSHAVGEMSRVWAARNPNTVLR